MQKKLILRLGIPAAILTASIVLLSYGRAEKPSKPVKDTKSTCCKKIKSACGDTDTRGGDDMILENLSRQFISISPL